MAKVRVTCSKCSKRFDPNSHVVTKTAAIAAGAAGGAAAGSSVGIVAGPLGAISGTIPGAIAGGTAAAFGDKSFAKCPKCGKVQKV